MTYPGNMNFYIYNETGVQIGQEASQNCTVAKMYLEPISPNPEPKLFTTTVYWLSNLLASYYFHKV